MSSINKQPNLNQGQNLNELNTIQDYLVKCWTLISTPHENATYDIFAVPHNCCMNNVSYPMKVKRLHIHFPKKIKSTTVFLISFLDSDTDLEI